jgi:hypothetical protein
MELDNVAQSDKETGVRQMPYRLLRSLQVVCQTR